MREAGHQEHPCPQGPDHHSAVERRIQRRGCGWRCDRFPEPELDRRTLRPAAAGRLLLDRNAGNQRLCRPGGGPALHPLPPALLWRDHRRWNTRRDTQQHTCITGIFRHSKVRGMTVTSATQISSPVLVAQGLKAGYDGVPVVHGLDLVINHGEVVALLGANGAGKTTLFSVVLGILNPTQGKVIFNNKVINELPIHMRAKEGISYLPQARSIFRGLTVEENIRAVAEVAIKDEEKQDELVEHLLNEFKIAHLRTASALSLSGGEARRVEIARCLTTSPKVLLLDEPFAALDPIAIIELKEMLRHLKDKGISIFITDHNVKETLDIVDRAYIINSGELIAEGSPQEIVENKKARQLYLGSQFRI